MSCSAGHWISDPSRIPVLCIAVHMAPQHTLDAESASFETARKGGKIRRDIDTTSVVVRLRVPDIYLTHVTGRTTQAEVE